MNLGNQTQAVDLGRLSSLVRAPAELTSGEREQMFRLLNDHYENVRHDDFARDLAEKEWVIVVSDPGRGILGFTTIMRLVAECRGQRLVAFYSGDTVLDPDIWGTSGWSRTWGRLAAKVMQEMNGEPLYWLLLTATHRTYRFLPTFLQEYYPREGVPTPPLVRERIEALVRLKFADEFDARRGIVRTRRPLAVRPERVELATGGISGEHAAFFARSNPGYLQGDYLVCLADLSVGNRTRLGHKLFALDEAP